MSETNRREFIDFLLYTLTCFIIMCVNFSSSSYSSTDLNELDLIYKEHLIHFVGLICRQSSIKGCCNSFFRI